jgi:hypothetical protein
MPLHSEKTVPLTLHKHRAQQGATQSKDSAFGGLSNSWRHRVLTVLYFFLPIVRWSGKNSLA